MILPSLHLPHTSESGLCSLLTGLFSTPTAWQTVISITAQIIEGAGYSVAYYWQTFSLDYRVLSQFCVAPKVCRNAPSCGGNFLSDSRLSEHNGIELILRPLP